MPSRKPKPTKKATPKKPVARKKPARVEAVKPPADPPPLVGAVGRAAAEKRDVTVEPPVPQIHARDPGTQHTPPDGLTVSVHKLTPDEVADHCKRNPIFENKLDPDPSLPFATRAAYSHVLKTMKDEDRAALYEKGGIRLIKETVMDAVRKLSDAGV